MSRRRKRRRNKEGFSPAALIVAIVATAITLLFFSGKAESTLDHVIKTISTFIANAGK